MKKLREILKSCSAYLWNAVIWMCPFILFLLSIALIIYVLRGDFDKYIRLLSITIWPITILLALFFFRKVVTYLFFTMDEFNFFGAKGELKDITEVIDRRVEKRIKDEKDDQKRSEEIKAIADSLEKARLSHDGAEKKAQENLKLAKDIFAEYKELTGKHAEATKELEDFRQKETQRRERVRAMIRHRQAKIDERLTDRPEGENEKSVPSTATDSTNETVLPKGE